MKIIRYIAALLMLVSAVWHGILSFQTAENRPMLAFAVLFLIVSILLLAGNSWGLYLGILFPVAGIIIASIKIGWSNFDATIMVLIAMDIVVILSCLGILLTRKKPSIVT